jgi:hypothetical protein
MRRVDGNWRRAAVLLVVLISGAGAAPVRFALDACLLGAAAGPLYIPADTTRPFGANFDFPVARIGVGLEESHGFGLTVGTMLAQVGGYELSTLPLGARLWYDFAPDERWRHATAYLSGAWHSNSFWGDFNPNPDYFELAAGATYTFYAVTPKVEFRFRSKSYSGSQAMFLLGVDIGGQYVFGRR